MASTEAPISITVKTAAGSLVTVRAETGAELDQTIALSLESIKAATQELETAIKGGSGFNAAVTNVAAQFPGAQVVSETPPFNEAPIGGGRTCPHGKMTALQGPSKQGGIYKGYFCPSPQGDVTKCKTVYVNERSPEWNTFIPDRVK